MKNDVLNNLDALNTALCLTGRLDGRLVIEPTEHGHIVSVACNQTIPGRLMARVVHDWADNTLDEVLTEVGNILKNKLGDEE